MGKLTKNKSDSHSQVQTVLVQLSEVHLYVYIRFIRGGSRTAATSKMERFMIIVNGWKPLTIITKRSILDPAAVLDPPLFI